MSLVDKRYFQLDNNNSQKRVGHPISKIIWAWFSLTFIPFFILNGVIHSIVFWDGSRENNCKCREWLSLARLQAIKYTQSVADTATILHSLQHFPRREMGTKMFWKQCKWADSFLRRKCTLTKGRQSTVRSLSKTILASQVTKVQCNPIFMTDEMTTLYYTAFSVHTHIVSTSSLVAFGKVGDVRRFVMQY